MSERFMVIKRNGEERMCYLMKDAKTWTNMYSPLVGRWKQDTAALHAMAVVLSAQEYAEGWKVRICHY